MRVQAGWGSFLRAGGFVETGFGLRRDPVTLELYGGIGGYGDARHDERYRAMRLTLGADIKLGGRLVAILADWGLGVCGSFFGKNWGIESLGPFEPGLFVGIGGQYVTGTTPLPRNAFGGFVRLGIALDLRFDPLVVGIRLTGAGNRFLGVDNERVPSSVREEGSLGFNVAVAF